MGIGGIGMSAIAKVLKERGYRVSGCDNDLEQKSVKQLQELGCPIAGTHSSTLCHDQSIDVLVYSAAVNLNHPELLHAHRRQIPVVPRARMLAELMRAHYGIAVAGAHGKTTTTAMVSHILLEAGLDPTVIIGGFLKNIGTNGRRGTGDLLVAEADESDKSLSYLPASFAVVTNIDREHLDTYKDLDEIIATFKQFLDNLPFYGKAIMCVDDPVIHSILPTIPHIKTVRYGLEHEAHVSAADIVFERDGTRSMLVLDGVPRAQLVVPVAGKHNLLNALAAIAVTLEVGVTLELAVSALATFAGVERRFCCHGTFRGASVFDDYAHNPPKIACALQVARARTAGRLIVVFQPHRYSRTHHLWQEFIQTFIAGNIDELIITDIYSASEAPIAGITSEQFAQDLKLEKPDFSVHYIPQNSDFGAVIAHLESHVQTDDLILILGAGNVYKIAGQLVQKET